MPLPAKACPVVLRLATELEVLAFEHPLEGFQLVKGTIETNESPSEAAVRELHEESGLRGRAVRDIGLWDSGYRGQVWSLHLCEVPPPLPETWVHRTEDDGGHDFRFFWHPLRQEPGPRWHEIFRSALEHLRREL
ncbi:NUDIX domain-containing protein [Ramlibacter sp.]|uniref:NUDIX hydrolase n=1 Tax=Ramlibacter sp. TaxID=1917967 RepID=UPI0035B09251